MNLLIDSEAIAENGGAESGTSAPAAGTRRAVNDENTQEQIRSALEMELTSPAAPAPPQQPAQPEAAAEVDAEVAPVQTLPPEPEAAPAPDTPDTSAPQQPPTSQQEAPAPEPAPSTPAQAAADGQEPLAAADEADEEMDEEDDDNVDDYICFNVTQALVEDKTDKYMKMFGMCSCNRCRIDVIALALSNLPAKYVVAKPKDMIPRLSMYESKYSAAVITQVMKACKKVIDLPHHKR